MMVYSKLAETLSLEKRRPLSKAIIHAYTSILSHRIFLSYAFVVGIGNAILFTYIFYLSLSVNTKAWGSVKYSSRFILV